MKKMLRVAGGALAGVLVVGLPLAPSASAAQSASTAQTASAAQSAQLPPMGYNTWYQYHAAANETDVLNQAQNLVKYGLAAKGYNLLDLDDGWMAQQRTASGALTWDTSKFPDGIPWLAKKLHSMGLKLGIYEAIGSRTCQSYPGSLGHYAQDAQTFANWGVDLVKIDQCGGYPAGTTVTSLTQDFQQYGAYLRQYNPNVIYSEELPIFALGTSSFLSTVQASATFANMWRVAADEYPLTHAAASGMILDHLAADLHLHAYAGPGHWNDLDMVAPDMPSDGWTLADLENQLGVWAIEASPLLISADLASLTQPELAALGNPDMIAIDQSGAQAPEAITSGNIEAVIKSADGGKAVLFANLSTTASASATFTLAQFGISTAKASSYQVWSNQTTTISGESITLQAGQTALVVFRPVRPYSAATPRTVGGFTPAPPVGRKVTAPAPPRTLGP